MAKHCANCGHELRGSDKFCNVRLRGKRHIRNEPQPLKGGS